MRRADRTEALHEHKRRAILAAAQEVFAAHGLEGATMRAIAGQAGYVAGAIYAYFPTREAILAALLVQSLGSVGRAVKAAATSVAPADQLGATADALYRYYRDAPNEFALLLVLARREVRVTLPADIERQINGRLIALLQALAGAIEASSGLDAAAAQDAAVSLYASVTGTLLLEASGRLDVLGRNGAALVDGAVAAFLER